jgi:hypothetical protein
MVLFPLVVKREDGEDIVVCPAQVLVAKPDPPKAKKAVRVVSAQEQRGEGMSVGNRSQQSFAPSTTDAGVGNMF